MQKYKKQGEQGFFGEHFRLEKISKQGDPLERLNAVINWDIFNPILEKCRVKEKKSNAGAKPYNSLMMYRMKRQYGISGNS